MGGRPLLTEGVTPCFFRACIDNDRGGTGGRSYASRLVTSLSMCSLCWSCLYVLSVSSHVLHPHCTHLFIKLLAGLLLDMKLDHSVCPVADHCVQYNKARQ